MVMCLRCTDLARLVRWWQRIRVGWLRWVPAGLIVPIPVPGPYPRTMKLDQ